MRRFPSHIRAALLCMAAGGAAQSCFTYIPTMERESDGVYYSASRDDRRAQRERYYAYDYYDDSPQDDYYDAADAYMTPVEYAYWRSMPAKYRNLGQVKVLNTYYPDYYYDPAAPKVSIAFGFGSYGPGWGLSLSFGYPTYYSQPYWLRPYYYPAPWRPWYGPSWGWHRPWYGPGPWGWNDPWYGPGPWGWNDPYWWHHGYNPGFPGPGPVDRPPMQRPPRRYTGDTAPEYNRRPGGGTARPIGNPSDVRNPSGSTSRPASGVSSEGYNRRPSGNPGASSSSIRYPGQSAAPSNRGTGTTSSSGQVRRSGYQNIRSGGTTTSSARRESYRSSTGGTSTRSYSPGNSSSSSRRYEDSSSSGYDYSASRANYNQQPSSSTRSYSPPASGSSSSWSGGSGTSSSGTSSSGYGRR